jgi:hypothetical protein
VRYGFISSPAVDAATRLVDADKFEIIESDGLNAGLELYEGVVLTV